MGSMPPQPADTPKHDASQDLRAQFPHYHKYVGHLKYVDVYRVLALFSVTDPCIQHAVKKLLVPGKRTAGKSREQDIREAIASLNRALQMLAEDDQPVEVAFDPQTITCQDCRGKPCTRTDACPYRAARYGSPATAQTPGGQG